MRTRFPLIVRTYLVLIIYTCIKGGFYARKAIFLLLLSSALGLTACGASDSVHIGDALPDLPVGKKPTHEPSTNPSPTPAPHPDPAPSDPDNGLPPESEPVPEPPTTGPDDGDRDEAELPPPVTTPGMRFICEGIRLQGNGSNHLRTFSSFTRASQPPALLTLYHRSGDLPSPNEEVGDQLTQVINPVLISANRDQMTLLIEGKRRDARAQSGRLIYYAEADLIYGRGRTQVLRPAPVFDARVLDWAQRMKLQVAAYGGSSANGGYLFIPSEDLKELEVISAKNKKVLARLLVELSFNPRLDASGLWLLLDTLMPEGGSGASEITNRWRTRVFDFRSLISSQVVREIPIPVTNSGVYSLRSLGENTWSWLEIRQSGRDMERALVIWNSETGAMKREGLSGDGRQPHVMTEMNGLLLSGFEEIQSETGGATHLKKAEILAYDRSGKKQKSIPYPDGLAESVAKIGAYLSVPRPLLTGLWVHEGSLFAEFGVKNRAVYRYVDEAKTWRRLSLDWCEGNAVGAIDSSEGIQ